MGKICHGELEGGGSRPQEDWDGISREQGDLVEIQLGDGLG